MTDYTNYMSVTSVPSHIKWAITLLIILNIFLYKKFKISRYIEEYFSAYILTYASLGFLIYATFLFATHGVDTYIEVFCTVLGFFISLSYLSSVYKDAKNKRIGKKWLFIVSIIAIDFILFYQIEFKMMSYIFCLVQTAIFMIYESVKFQKNK